MCKLFKINGEKDLETSHFFSESLCEKCPNREFFLVRVFPYSVQMRENTELKRTPYLDTFHAVYPLNQ